MTEGTHTAGSISKPSADHSDPRPVQPGSSGSPVLRHLFRALSPKNISAIYVFGVIVIVFSLWVPDTFLTASTWRTILDGQAVTALLAVGLVIAMSAGAFDLAIGAELGLGSILVAWLMIRQGVPVVPAIALTVLLGAAIGAAQGLLVVRVRIDSFVASLGTSSVLLAVIAWVSSSQQILGLSAGFQEIGNLQFLGITLPVYLLVAIALMVWYVLERTPIGRRVYATGGNIEAARLAGVPTALVVTCALAACGAIAAFSGVLVSARLGAADPSVGPSYLLPAFSAAFLGCTQFRGGRFNVWGTVVAVYVIATGVKGLQLAGAPIWIPDLFNGIVLLVAVGVSKYQVAPRRTNAPRRTHFGHAETNS